MSPPLLLFFLHLFLFTHLAPSPFHPLAFTAEESIYIKTQPMGEQNATLFIVEQMLKIPSSRLLARQFLETLDVSKGGIACKLTAESVLQNASKRYTKRSYSKMADIPKVLYFLGKLKKKRHLVFLLKSQTTFKSCPHGHKKQSRVSPMGLSFNTGGF